ncbi:hypothetical protein PspLS_12031 [Pyricularia sp. CBS 133598]|nr:hypothetical protein PspLS_12031 [Pyricularia sp. CBS 133598]
MYSTPLLSTTCLFLLLGSAKSSLVRCKPSQQPPDGKGLILDEVIKLGPDPDRHDKLCTVLRAHSLAAHESQRPPNVDIVRQAEESVAANPGLFTTDLLGNNWLTVGENQWSAGRFNTIQVESLRSKARAAKNIHRASPKPRLRLWLLVGSTVATDIGALQATAGEDALFQVASQFNCLESWTPEQIVNVHQYFRDNTQGPRAAISAFPGTLLRHYRATSTESHGRPFVQTTNGQQINLLDQVVDGSTKLVRNGYLTGEHMTNIPELVKTIKAKEYKIKVGLHTDVEVVLGANWHGHVEGSPLITQVFTSTVAGGFYKGQEFFGKDFPEISSSLLRAAYKGTLYAAASRRMRKAVLTLIGGGGFSNDVGTIWEAIGVALDEVEPVLSRNLDVFINIRNMGELTSRVKVQNVLQRVRRFGGAIIRFEDGDKISVER